MGISINHPFIPNIVKKCIIGGGSGQTSGQSVHEHEFGKRLSGA